MISDTMFHASMVVGRISQRVRRSLRFHRSAVTAKVKKNKNAQKQRRFPTPVKTLTHNLIGTRVHLGYSTYTSQPTYISSGHVTDTRTRIARLAIITYCHIGYRGHWSSSGMTGWIKSLPRSITASNRIILVCTAPIIAGALLNLFQNLNFLRMR